MRFNFTINILFTFLFLNCFGQKLNEHKFYVKTIAQNEGLSQLGITSLDLDSIGYLWIATQNGLNKYNSKQIQTYYSGTKKTDLKDDHIRSVLFLKDTLWITTNTYSVNAYIPKTNQFLSFENNQNLKKNKHLNYSYSITYSKKNIISGTVGHCLMINRKTLEISYLKIPNIKENDFVNTIVKVDNNLYLIGTNASGLYFFDEKKKEIYKNPVFKGLENHKVNSLLKNNQNIYIGSNEGLYKYDALKKTIIKLNNFTINSLAKWLDGKIFVGGDNRNYLLQKTQDKLEPISFYDANQNELETTVFSVLHDRIGGIFFGTNTHGLLYYHPLQRKFSPQRIHLQESQKKDFISIFNFLKNDQDLWMVTEMGFVKYNFNNKNYKAYVTNNLEYTIIKDANDDIWAGGFDQGLVKYDKKKDDFIKINLPFEDKDVIQLTQISKEVIWIHTWSGGIFEMNLRSQKINPILFNGKKIMRSRISYIDSKKIIWLGSDDGLYAINGEKIIHYTKLSNPRIFGIAEDSNNNIWVGTAKGLNKINPQTKKIYQYKQQAGLPNDFIYGLLVDKKDRIWASTNFGISVYNPQTNGFVNYTEEDGLQNNEFNGKAVYKDENGLFYFGGMNGYNIINPENIEQNKKTSKTVIEDVKLFGLSINKNINYTDTLYFSHNENVISFDFMNLNFLRSEKNRYQFILEGFDQNWRPITKETSTTYTNLNPGTYIFRVKGSNNDMIWGSHKQLVIIIKSPWYKTLWFRATAIVSVFLSILLFFFYKNRQQKNINKRLSSMVKARTHELHQSNKELNLSLETSQKQKENIAFLMQELNHRVKNNLQIITSLIDLQSFDFEDADVQNKLQLLQSRIYTIAKVHDLLNNNNKHLTNPADFIKELVDDLILFSGQEIDVDYQLHPIRLDSNHLTYLGLIFNELITNSIKHAFTKSSKPKKICLSAEENTNQIIFTYSDSGDGFVINEINIEKSKGIALIFTLIEELKGSINISKKTGSSVIITLPKQM